MMCEKRKSSLKKLATRLPRPVHAVTPEPAVPLHYPQGHANVHPHSHPASPLHADLPKSPKSMRKASTLPKVSSHVVVGCVTLLYSLTSSYTVSVCPWWRIEKQWIISGTLTIVVFPLQMLLLMSGGFWFKGGRICSWWHRWFCLKPLPDTEKEARIKFQN